MKTDSGMVYRRPGKLGKAHCADLSFLGHKYNNCVMVNFLSTWHKLGSFGKGEALPLSE